MMDQWKKIVGAIVATAGVIGAGGIPVALTFMQQFEAAHSTAQAAKDNSADLQRRVDKLRAERDAWMSVCAQNARKE